jgi:hypothetical protein
MQPDAVQRKNKPLECRVILLGALSLWQFVEPDKSLAGKLNRIFHPSFGANQELPWPTSSAHPVVWIGSYWAPCPRSIHRQRAVGHRDRETGLTESLCGYSGCNISTLCAGQPSWPRVSVLHRDRLPPPPNAPPDRVRTLPVRGKNLSFVRGPSPPSRYLPRPSWPMTVIRLCQKVT